MYSILNKNIYNFDETSFQMGIAATSKVIINFDIINQTIVVQPNNCKWVTVIERINAAG